MMTTRQVEKTMELVTLVGLVLVTSFAFICVLNILFRMFG